MSEEQLQAFYERSEDTPASQDDWQQSHEQLLRGLESGRIRAAERGRDGNWHAVMWVKRAILTGFKNADVVRQGPIGQPPFFDKESYPARSFEPTDLVRVVPGGTSVRRGAYVSSGVVIMPPAYVNVGAYVDSGTMIDSHALVGSCAQVGKNVHLSAGAQIGGVLEPINASPVIIEDDVFVAALCGVFEGFVVRERAVLATGVTLTAATVIYDLVHGVERRGEVPANAVVVPGTRPASGEFAKERGLQIAAPMIVKYRDERTDASTALESALR
ncbi:MAG TPA: 2,3,4,5-tetrahydropyridine-2,6-dicarboxylate N-succinyltransferase [Planctomycetes bacterium]|jgi:2,3,4,5-tetrahydropyridine-2-carboxylate N-succinyltransferase|nr:2,3,4,5-tetrahydropyridine-2,6-dicarboxylate N-succinyltransferase [Planctomycetota bacterium]